MEKLKYERPVIQKLNTGLMNKFGMNTEYKPMEDIEGIPVKRLIEQYGSPLFVLSENKIRNKYKELYTSFSVRYPKVQFAWSYKTNYLDAVCRIFHQEGSWAEVVSGFEYDKAIGNGVKGSQIIFNGPDKNDEELKKAVNKDPNNFDFHYALADHYIKTNQLNRAINIAEDIKRLFPDNQMGANIINYIENLKN